MRLLLISAMLGLLISGCSSPKTNYYTLSSEPIPPELVGAKEISIMVGPVALPSLLDQPRLVTWGGETEVQVHEYHRWAGSFKNDIGRSLASSLARELGTPNVWNFAQSTQTNFDYQIFIDVQNMESKIGQEVMVDVLWTIKPAVAMKKVSLSTETTLKSKSLMGRYLVREPVSDASMDALVIAQSRAIAKVGSKIAQSLR